MIKVWWSPKTVTFRVMYGGLPPPYLTFLLNREVIYILNV